MHPLLPLLAVALDFCFRDAEPWPHPVRLIGQFLDQLEERARQQTRISLSAAGWISLLLLVLVTGTITWIAINIPLIGLLIALYLAYSGLSLAGLLAAARHITGLMDAGRESEAKISLGLLVSRDTSALDRQGVYRTLAETVSENINDGFVAPLFYLLLGGPVLLWIYKAISTMDSMWGYPTSMWRQLGRAGARTEDVLSAVPARITYLLAVLAAWLLRLSWRDALLRTPSQARRMKSPNAGWPMAACAWAVGAEMGGEALYFGQVREKPRLGPSGGDWDRKAIQNLFRLTLVLGLVWTVLGCAVLWMAV
ncbi:MAG: cobalamin biosynthesis protein [Desulfohalobiaceae bacterium]|nr:cobalamin biosynthesis protein [Desulfohalobiaceae bacterium]